MHEQAHDQKQMPSAAESAKTETDAMVAQIAERMRAYALANPCFSAEETNAACLSLHFSTLLKLTETVFLHVILTVSPDDAETTLFWHCSMSFVSAESGRAKSVGLWTTRELKLAKVLLPKFLGAVGARETSRRYQTATAFHLSRKLTDSEFETAAESAKN